MKKIILFFTLLSISSLNAQTFDLSYTITPNSFFGMGLSVNDLFGKTGLYLRIQGIGVDFSSESGVDYSSIADRTEYSKETIDAVDHSSLTIGLTFNITELLNSKKDIHIATGLGYDTKYTWISWDEYYIWDNYPELNEGNYLSRTDIENSFVFEATINYAIMKNIGIIGGYNSIQGPIFGAFFRF